LLDARRGAGHLRKMVERPLQNVLVLNDQAIPVGVL